MAVGVACINHDRRWKAGCFQRFANLSHALGIVIRCFAAAKDDVAVFIAACDNNSGVAAFCDGKEDMFVCCRFNGINGDFDVAVSAVLESDRAGKTARQFTMHLTFCGSSSDRPPGD